MIHQKFHFSYVSRPVNFAVFAFTIILLQRGCTTSNVWVPHTGRNWGWIFHFGPYIVKQIYSNKSAKFSYKGIHTWILRFWETTLNGWILIEFFIIKYFARRFYKSKTFWICLMCKAVSKRLLHENSLAKLLYFCFSCKMFYLEYIEKICPVCAPSMIRL